MAKASTGDILRRLNSVDGYHPFTASTFSDWSIEAGDIISVSRDGTKYQSPVCSSTLVWKGQPQVNVSSTGTQEREAIAVMSAKEYSGSARSGNSYRSGVYRGRYDSTLESHIQESERQVLISIDNLDKKLGTRIDQTDTSVSMSVGRLKYSKIEKYATKDKFPASGNADTLYVAKDTGLNYIWSNPPGVYYLATVTSDGEVNYVKAGEIAIAFNEQKGQTEAKLDADVIYAGKKNGKLVSLADLELPDWMGATDSGIVALQGNFGTLNAKVANLDKVVAKALTTEDLTARIAGIKRLGVQHLAASGSISVKAGNVYYAIERSIKDIQITQSGNDYTLQVKKWGDSRWSNAGNFSRATSLSAKWSSGTGTITATPQDEKYIIKLAEIQGYWVGNTYYGLVGDTNHNNEYTGFNYSVDASDKISDAAKVSSSEIGGGVGGVTPQSAGTSPISGRYNIGYANLPTVPSYLLVTLSCRGTRRQAYITLG